MKINAYKIKMILAEAEMTRADLAAKCRVSRQSISTILTRGTCELRTAGKIAKALGIPVSEITAEVD